MIFNTFVNPIALSAIGWRYYFVFVSVLACYAVTSYFFYPETKGYSLEHMALIFDGEAAAVCGNQDKLEAKAQMEGDVVEIERV